MTLRRAVRAVTRTLGHLFEHNATQVDFCTCCPGDARLQRCDELLEGGLRGSP